MILVIEIKLRFFEDEGVDTLGGYGTRLRPITHPQQKQLIPVANKPILFYPIEDVIEAGAEEKGIIPGPNEDQIIETVNFVEWDVDIESSVRVSRKDWLTPSSRQMNSLTTRSSSCILEITS